MKPETEDPIEEAFMAIASSYYHSLGAPCSCPEGPCTCGAIIE